MTRDDIIRMAEQCGIPEYDNNESQADCILSFASLVVAAERDACLQQIGIIVEAEREACAKVCEQKVDAEYATGKVDHNEMGWTQACAISIRARGETK